MTQALTSDELLAMIAKLRAENDALRSAPPKRLTCKVSIKGALSLYGLGRFPVTLYRTQWERLLAEANTITAFIKTNDALLATKDEA